MNIIEDIIEIVIDKYDISNLIHSSKKDVSDDSFSMKLSLMESGLLSSREIIHNKKISQISNLCKLFYFSNNV